MCWTAGVSSSPPACEVEVNYQEQLNAIFDRYREEVSPDPTSLDDVIEWALDKGLCQPSRKSVIQIFREDLAESLRNAKRIDEKGRSYRAKISVRETVGGVQMFLWADADFAPRSFVQKSAAQRRRAIAHDCFQLKQDIDHFNDTRGLENPIQLRLDFAEDVRELEAEAILMRKKVEA